MSTASREIERPRISTAATLAYAQGSFGTGVFSTVPTILLLYYCTEIIGLSPAWGAAIVFVPKLWAIAWDPLVGAWSDRTRGRFGRRRPFLAAGALGVAATFIALFSPPQLDSIHGTALWIASAYFALATVYSLFAVPYIAIPAEIGADPHTRSRLVGWRMTMAMIGVLTGAGLAPYMIAAAGGGREGYSTMALVLGFTCGLLMSIPIFMLRNHDRPSVSASHPRSTGLFSQLRTALKNRNFVSLASAYLLQMAAAGVLSSAAPYLVVRTLGRPESDIGTAFAALLITTTIMTPLWSWTGRKTSERTMLALGAILYAIASIALGIAGDNQTSWPHALALFAAVGVPFAAVQVLPFTLLAHSIHDQSQVDTSAEGMLTGLWTAAEKLGLAMGPALTGVALTIGSSDPASITPKFIAIVPAVLIAASMLVLFLQRTPALIASDSDGRGPVVRSSRAAVPE